MTHSKNHPAVRTALALGLTLASAVALPSNDAAAFGWSDITGAAKKVGGAVKKGAKVTGIVAVEAVKTPQEAVNKAKEITRTTVGRVVGEISHAGVVKGFKRVLNAEELRELKNAKDWFGDGYGKAANIALGIDDHIKDAVVGKAKGVAKGVAKEAWGKISNGKYERVGSRNSGPVVGHPGFTRPVGKSGPVTGRAGFTRPVGTTKTTRLQKGTKAPVQGITLQNLKPAKGQTPKNAQKGRPLGNDRSAWGRPVGGRKPIGNDKSVWGHPVGGRKPIGNDKSVWGRPVGGRKPIGQDRSKMGRPMGITKQDLQPRRKSGRKMQMKRMKQKFPRDLSRNKGRNGRDGRKFENKRQNFKAQNKRQNSKMQMKRGNTKRSFPNRGRGNRRG